MESQERSATAHFYENLTPHDTTLAELIGNEDYLEPIPNDWWFVITDIKNSTKAYEDHRYRDLTTASIRSLAIALNISHTYGIEVPYTFGGDGATLVVPPEMKDDIVGSLAHFSDDIERSMNFDMRVAAISIAELHKKGFTPRISKITRWHSGTESLFTDASLYYAENLIKDDPAYQVVSAEHQGDPYDYSGIQPTWQILYDPDDNEHALALIIIATDQNSHTKAYLPVLRAIEQIFGDRSERHPYIKTPTGQAFPTDGLKFDGTMKSILIGSQEKIDALMAILDELESQRLLLYGHLVTDAAISTAIIQETPTSEVALVDLVDGGYVAAARKLKEKLKERNAT